MERLLDTLAAARRCRCWSSSTTHTIFAARRSTGLVLRLARGLPAPHRLLVAARRLAPGLEPLRTLPAACLDTSALEFTQPEARALISSYRGRPPSDWEVRVLLEATRGWATALVLATSSAGVDRRAPSGAQPERP